MNKLSVVGIGPGNEENMTLAADKALRECDVIVGYTVYVDLVKERYPDKEFLTTPMTREAQRCRLALDEAKKGRHVAMVCSGDSGIYGMAALAACSGGALLGAPLTHDFAVISLSDRLTPWEKIEKRLECAALGDMSIVLYNPRSKGRPDNLRMACDILLRHLPEDRPCGVAHSIGRAGEGRSFMTLGQLRSAQLDMFSTVFIGNAMTRMIGEEMVTPRGYRDV